MSNSKMGRKQSGFYSDHFCISRILSGYPVFANSVYIVFTTVCVAIAMSLLNLLSECGLLSCDYILHVLQNMNSSPEAVDRPLVG